ncbi:MAG: RNA 2',3'-cyclic phosphodiesterase [Acidobacteriota bacterium]|nr:RNA 2',3'-cyclic phosphodiesterase [Acidobacteriota bacterium]
MRLFVALDISPSIRERVERFIGELLPLAPNARWIPTESLHVTLKFIGEATPAKSELIKHTLAACDGAAALELAVRGCGFFPDERRPRLFWAGIEPLAQLARLARTVDHALAPLGIAREEHLFQPHLTLARAKRNSPAFALKHLQEKLTIMQPPEFGTMTAREFFLYESQLSPERPRYTKIARFDLK